MKDTLFLDRKGRVKWYKVGILKEVSGLPFIYSLRDELLVNQNQFSNTQWDMMGRGDIVIGAKLLVLLDDRSMIGDKLNPAFGKPKLRNNNAVTLREFKKEYESQLA